MQRISLILGLGVVLGVLTGCPPTYPKCNSDDHCKDRNEVCVQGQCQECAADQHCKDGFVCETNKCVPKPECTADSGCTGNKRCIAGKCALECTDDKECGGRGKCQNNRCTVGACKTSEDCEAGEECISGTCQTRTVTKDACDWNPVRFGFNETSLTPEARSQLSALADCIKQAGRKVTVEGHADERGTEEYNLQLSSRRAASVRKYLLDLGVSAKTLDSVGYGKNRPAMEGHTEEAWSTNRRVEFKR